MPYSKSRSRVSFESNLSNLLSLSRKASYKNSTFSYDYQNMIYQSSIFLVCASIEEYIKSFIEDLIFEYRSKSATLGEIPQNSKTLALLNNQQHIFKSYVFNGDEARTLKKLQVNENIFAVLDESAILNYEVVAKTIIGTKKYPSLKNLKVLYNRIGITDIMAEANRRGARDFKSQLESFLNIREAISHQAPPPLTFTDVLRNFNNIKSLINYIDRIKYTHINKISGSNYWPN